MARTRINCTMVLCTSNLDAMNCLAVSSAVEAITEVAQTRHDVSLQKQSEEVSRVIKQRNIE